MKETDLKPSTEITQEKQKEVERVLTRSVRRVKGLKLFEYNTETEEIEEVVLNGESKLMLNGKTETKYRVDKKVYCLYIQSLNKANALRKVKNALNASR